MQVRKHQTDASRHNLLLAAGFDKEQVLLPIVEETKVARRRTLGAGLTDVHAGIHAGVDAGKAANAQQRHELARRRGRLHALSGEKRADELERLGRNARPIAQARDELAIIDGAPPKGRLGHASAPAELRDAVQQTDSRMGHCPAPSPAFRPRAQPSWAPGLERPFRSFDAGVYGKLHWDDNHKQDSKVIGRDPTTGRPGGAADGAAQPTGPHALSLALRGRAAFNAGRAEGASS